MINNTVNPAVLTDSNLTEQTTNTNPVAGQTSANVEAPVRKRAPGGGRKRVKMTKMISCVRKDGNLTFRGVGKPRKDEVVEKVQVPWNWKRGDVIPIVPTIAS